MLQLYHNDIPGPAAPPHPHLQARPAQMGEPERRRSTRSSNRRRGWAGSEQRWNAGERNQSSQQSTLRGRHSRFVISASRQIA